MKKIFALILTICLCMILFTGCAPDVEPSVSEKEEVSKAPVESEKEPEPVTLRVETFYGESNGNAEAYSQIIEEYKVIAPHVTIDRNDYRSELLISPTVDWVDHPPPYPEVSDVIFWFTGPNASTLMGNVISIDEIREVDPDYCVNVRQSVIDSVKEADYDMKAYAIPTSGFWEGLFVNEKLLERYELAVPSTWDELINVCKVLRENGITPIAQGMADEPHYLIELMLASGAGEEYQQVPTSASEVPESWITGLNGLKLLAEAGAFPKNEATLGHGDAITMFTEGKSAMIADGSWRCNILRFSEWNDDGNFVANSEKWDDEDVVAPEKQLSRFVTVIPMPTVPGGKEGKVVIPGGSSSGWYITTEAWNDPAKRAEAIEFVKYVCSDDNIMRLNTGCPTNGAAMANLTRPQQDGYSLFLSADLLVPPINDRMKSEVWDHLWKNTASILGNADAKDIFDDAFNSTAK